MIEKSEKEIMSTWKNSCSASPMVSIRCTVYNHADYLEQTLDGFLMQVTDFPFEVVIHDDASTDNSASIIKEYEMKYPTIIKPIYETENQYSKRNNALFFVIRPRLHGKYIAFCEGDDYWIDINKLQKQVDYMELHPDCGLCHTNFNFFYQETQTLEYDMLHSHKDRFPSAYTLEQWILSAGYTGPMTWVFRRELYNQYIPLKTLDGSFVMYAFFLANSNVKCMDDEITAVYRVLEESASHSTNINKAYARNKSVHETQLQLANMYNLSSEVIERINQSYYKMAIWQIVMMNESNEIEKAIRYNVSYFKRIVLKLARINSFRKMLRLLWYVKNKLR